MEEEITDAGSSNKGEMSNDVMTENENHTKDLSSNTNHINDNSKDELYMNKNIISAHSKEDEKDLSNIKNDNEELGETDCSGNNTKDDDNYNSMTIDNDETAAKESLSNNNDTQSISIESRENFVSNTEEDNRLKAQQEVINFLVALGAMKNESSLDGKINNSDLNYNALNFSSQIPLIHNLSMKEQLDSFNYVASITDHLLEYFTHHEIFEVLLRPESNDQDCNGGNNGANNNQRICPECGYQTHKKSNMDRHLKSHENRNYRPRSKTNNTSQQSSLLLPNDSNSINNLGLLGYFLNLPSNLQSSILLGNLLDTLTSNLAENLGENLNNNLLEQLLGNSVFENKLSNNALENISNNVLGNLSELNLNPMNLASHSLINELLASDSKKASSTHQLESESKSISSSTSIKNPLKCGECQQQFRDAWYLRKHSCSGSRDQIHCCPECGYKSSKKGNLELHMRSHNTKPAYRLVT